MATVRALDGNGDIVTSGRQFLTGKEVRGQTISTRLQLFRGEYFRDITQGVPWFQSIMQKDVDLPVKNAIIQATIVETTGVNTLLSFQTDFDINTREYTVRASVLTDEGVVELNQTGGTP